MAWDPIWEEIYRVRDLGKYPAEDLIRFIARNFYKAPNRKDIKILEVGCGQGANIWYIAREGFSIYGVDGSSSAIDYAKKRLDQEISGWSGSLTVGDVVSLDFEDNYFDAVIDNEAVTHNSFENSKAIYNEMQELQKKVENFFRVLLLQDAGETDQERTLGIILGLFQKVLWNWGNTFVSLILKRYLNC